MKRKVLLIVDAQNDFCSEGGSLSNAECIETVGNIAELLRLGKFDKVVCTLDTHFRESYFETMEGKKLPIKHCLRGTEGWELNGLIDRELKRLESEGTEVERIEKCTFGCMDFEDKYRLHDYDDIYVCGFCTDICVVSNALIIRASHENNSITVIGDCCAGTSVEKHEAALSVMESCHMDVISFNQLTKNNS